MHRGSHATSRRAVLLGALAAPVVLRAARAAPTLRVARQFGIGYAQMALLEDGKLVEKHAASAGLPGLDVTWSTFRSSDVMNDALLSGTLDIACLGVPGLGLIWDRTAGTRSEVKGLSGLNVAPLTLVTREPSVHSLLDYKPGMKIALPAVKVSNQAIFLEMAAAKQWGPDQFARLDPLTVSMAHPDALVALLSPGSEIGSYFGAPPFVQRALKAPGVREVLNSADILGAAASFNILGTPTRFASANGPLIDAFLAALREATDSINRDRVAAAATYARVTGDKTPADELAEVMRTGVTYTLEVRGTVPILQFMAARGILKHTPASASEYLMSAASSGAT